RRPRHRHGAHPGRPGRAGRRRLRRDGPARHPGSLRPGGRGRHRPAGRGHLRAVQEAGHLGPGGGDHGAVGLDA
ncbi:hypothetical protein LTR94_038325, partial [Friedmanniomyces endolithicus]